MQRVVCSVNRLFFRRAGVEVRDRLVFDIVRELYRRAADLAVLDVSLASRREIKQHRNLLSAVRAIEKVFGWLHSALRVY